MPHELRINQFGKASFFTARIPAWHALGTVTKDALTSADAIVEADLNWKVIKTPVKFDGDDEIKEFPDQFVTKIESTHHPLGIVGRDYNIVQNIEAFQFFDDLVGRREAIFETAGAIRGGQKVFITAKLPGHMMVGGNDRVMKYLVAMNSHDGTGSLKLFFSPIRVVCSNTLHAAIRGARTTFNLRHSANINDKIDDARRVLGVIKDQSEELTQVFTKMRNTSIMDEDTRKFFSELFLTQEKHETLWKAFDGRILKMQAADLLSSRAVNTLRDVNKYYQKGIGQPEIVGTVYGAYNAVSGYFQNAKKSTNPEKFVESNVLGSNATKIHNAFDKALVLCER